MPKKRANGEGSIRHRKDGRWEGRYTAGHDPATGKPIYSALEVAVEQKIINRNPARRCVLPRVEHKEMKTLPLEDVPRLLEAAKPYNVFEMYYLVLVTGMRRGEICGLKWEDVDFKNKTIHVRRQAYRIDGVIQETQLKTRNSYRNISISNDTVKVLKQQRLKVEGPYVFPSPFGGILAPDSMNNTLHHVLDAAGLPRIRFHDLRHTFATIALQNGVDIKTVSSMLGHFSAGFTLDTYAHVTTAAQVEAANTMGNLLKNAAELIEQPTQVYAFG